MANCVADEKKGVLGNFLMGRPRSGFLQDKKCRVRIVAGVDGDLGFVVWLGLWLVVRQEKT